MLSSGDERAQLSGSREEAGCGGVRADEYWMCNGLGRPCHPVLGAFEVQTHQAPRQPGQHDST